MESTEFCKRLKNKHGEVIGLWVADPNHPQLFNLVEDFHAKEGLPADVFEAFQLVQYRTVPNTFDRKGGAFLMFGSAMAPGEIDSGKQAALDSQIQEFSNEYLAPLCLAGGFVLARYFLGQGGQIKWLWVWAGAITIVLGHKGFTARGIPLTSSNYITGIPARVIGVVVILIGVAIMYFDQLFRLASQ